MAKPNGNRAKLIQTLRYLALMLCALACVCSEDHSLGSAGEWSGLVYIASSEGSPKPNEMLFLSSDDDAHGTMPLSTWEFNQDPRLEDGEVGVAVQGAAACMAGTPAGLEDEPMRGEGDGLAGGEAVLQ